MVSVMTLKKAQQGPMQDWAGWINRCRRLRSSRTAPYHPDTSGNGREEVEVWVVKEH